MRLRGIALFTGSLAEARPLAAALSSRGVTATVTVAGELRLDSGVRTSDHGVVVNLVGEEASVGVRALAAEYLAYLADIEVPTVNGLDAFVVGSSRARQLALLDHVGVAHPPARVVADDALIPAALADLGLTSDAALVQPGPPIVVQAAAAAGDAVRIEYVAGRQLAAAVAGAPVTVDLDVSRLGATLVTTGGIEFGGVTFALDLTTRRPHCLGIDTALPTSPLGLDALVEHILTRAGRPT